MNGVDKDHRPELWSDIVASVDHSAYCKKKCLYVLFSGTVMLVLASLAVPRLTLVCVCACSCVGMSIWYVESLKFEGGAMVDMVPRQYFHLRKCTCSAVERSPWNVIVASCWRRSYANRFLVSLADVPQSCQQNLPYFCRVQSALAH